MHKISCAPERNETHGIFDTLSDIVSQFVHNCIVVQKLHGT